MTDGFTTSMLRWLQDKCALPVKVAEEGDVITPRRVLFTPENQHMVVTLGGRIHISEAEPVNGHLQSIDVTFNSVSKVYGARSAGVLPSPSKRSNTTRGFVSIGSGVCGLR